MAKITATVPDDIYKKARVKAAEKGVSVSALVTELLASLVDQESEFERLLALQREVMAEIEDFNGSDRLSRDEIHERSVR